MSFKTTELCLLLVDETYGELPAVGFGFLTRLPLWQKGDRIFKVLMIHGRQQIPAIVQHTGLTSNQVKHGLAVLVSQHLVLWTSGNPAFYEADWLTTYALLRRGKFIKAAQERFGDEAEVVFTQCMLDGDANANDLIHVAQAAAAVTKGHMLDSSEMGIDQIPASIIYGLLDHKLTVLSNASHFRTATENIICAEKHVRNVNSHWRDKIKNADKVIFSATIKNTTDEWKYGTPFVVDAIKDRNLGELPNRLKRDISVIEMDVPDSPIARKKSKKSNGVGNTAVNGELVDSFDTSIALRVNYDKYPVLVRSQKLIQMAAEKLTYKTSRVYAAVLHIADKDVSHCDEFKRDAETTMEDDRDTQTLISTKDILGATKDLTGLKDEIANPFIRATSRDRSPVLTPQRPKRRFLDLEDDTDDERMKDVEEDGSDSDITRTSRLKQNGKPFTNGKANGAPVQDIRYDNEFDHNSDDDSNNASNRRQILLNHLRLLAEHGFLDLHPPSALHGGKEMWSVPFRRLSHELRLAEINITLATHYGPHAMRVGRALQEKGKLDEKTLIQLVWMETKALRSVLASLHSVGYLEIQELPRDNNRAPSKTMYLWFFDEDRCARKMLEDYYQSISRCLQRLRHERDSVRELLEKTQRSDVKGREKEFLTPGEWIAFQKWRATEEKLLSEVARLDEGVVLLRDL